MKSGSTVRAWGSRTALFALLAGMTGLAGAQDLHAQANDPTGTMNDPRVGLRPAANGQPAEEVSLHMDLVANVGKPPQFDSITGNRGLTYANSDLAFGGNVVYQGNFSGFLAWDVSNPRSPQLLSSVLCATDQGDPSIYGNLLFVSAEAIRGRKDCGTQGVEDGADRMRGIRIFDVSNPREPRLVHNIQTCRGSHTNTLVPDPRDPNTLYIYVGGSSNVRDASEMADCSAGTVEENPNTAQYRVDIIRVPLNNPTASAVVGHVRLFEGLAPRGNRGGPTGCHDLTSYPAYNLVAGSCGSYGILIDASDPANPKRLDAVGDDNFSLWHTAVFNNDATTVVFTDEWGGGTQPRCRVDDPIRLGGNTALSIRDGKMTQHGYFKMAAAQTEQENCVSHNGGLIPVPGRDIMAQGWYQGGVNIFDFTDVDNVFEIGYFDRGPLDGEQMLTGGSWGMYWYNGYLYSSDMALGLDVFELKPSEFLSQNEIDAAKLVVMDEYNPQAQPKLVWPAAFPVARSYVDQLRRNNGIAANRLNAISQAIDAAERASGAARRDQLTQLAAQIDGDVAGASDSDRVRALAQAVRDLAGAAEEQ